MIKKTSHINIRLTQTQLVQLINFNEELDYTFEQIDIIVNETYIGMESIYDKSMQYLADTVSKRNPYENDENILCTNYIKKTLTI